MKGIAPRLTRTCNSNDVPSDMGAHICTTTNRSRELHLTLSELLCAEARFRAVPTRMICDLRAESNTADTCPVTSTPSSGFAPAALSRRWTIVPPQHPHTSRGVANLVVTD